MLLPSIRRLSTAAAIVAVLALAAGCGKSASSSSSSSTPTSNPSATAGLVTSTPAPSGPTGTVTWATYRAVSTLDPTHAFDYPENTVDSVLCDTLLRQSDTGVIGPGLATLTYTNPTTLVFDIKPGIKFWDGTPLTAADVVYSLERNTDPNVAGFYAAVFNRVKSITQTGNLQVTIALKQPDYWLEGELSSTPGFIISKAYAEKVGTAKYGSISAKAMCTGPYELKSWNSDELVASANPHYWDTSLQPKASEIVFKPVSTDQAATEALQTGELTGDYTLNISTLDQLKADPNLHVYLGPSYASDAFIVSAPKGSALANPKVRQALSLAIDRAGFIQTSYKGAALLPNTLANPGTWGYGKSVFQQAWDQLGPPKTDIAQAKSLIKSAGATGQTITIGMSSELNAINTEAVMFQSAGKQIGLNVQLHSVSAQNYINFFIDPKAREGIDGFFTVNYPDYADPAALYNTLVMPGGSQNYDGFNDPQITSLMNKARGEANDTQRATDVAQAQKLIMQQLPWIPVVDPETILIMSKKITGAPPTFAYMFTPWAAKIGAGASG